MPTLRRILKYTPAAVLGLLVVAWVVSQYRVLMIPLGPVGRHVVGIQEGSVTIEYLSNGGVDFLFKPRSPTSVASRLGWLGFIPIENDWLVMIPISLLVTGSLPLAIGAFTGYRFRLWHYLAFTALIAVELAYYLRWQG
jgi:hypothetical protein